MISEEMKTENLVIDPQPKSESTTAPNTSAAQPAAAEAEDKGSEWTAAQLVWLVVAVAAHAALLLALVMERVRDDRLERVEQQADVAWAAVCALRQQELALRADLDASAAALTALVDAAAVLLPDNTTAL